MYGKLAFIFVWKYFEWKQDFFPENWAKYITCFLLVNIKLYFKLICDSKSGFTYWKLVVWYHLKIYYYVCRKIFDNVGKLVKIFWLNAFRILFKKNSFEKNLCSTFSAYYWLFVHFFCRKTNILHKFQFPFHFGFFRLHFFLSKNIVCSDIFHITWVHPSSEIRGLCLMKLSKKTFQNLPFFTIWKSNQKFLISEEWGIQ